MIFMLMIIWLSSMIFFTLNHPLSFGSILLIQTIVVSLYTGVLNYNYWFSYILFLIMVGGMLILFIYMTSVASNEKFKTSKKIFYLILIFSIMTLILFIFTDNFFFNLMNLNYDMINQSFSLKNDYSMNKFTNFSSMLITLTLIMYLLITLIAIVKITETEYAPMRKKF